MKKFNGKNSFGLWQGDVKDLLVREDLLEALDDQPLRFDAIKALKGEERSAAKSRKAMDVQAKWIIFNCLADNVYRRGMHIETEKSVWERLESMYIDRSLRNRLSLKMQLYRLRMKEGTRIMDHIHEFYRIVFELEFIGVEINDEDKAILLINSLPASCERLVELILMNVKEDNLTLDEVDRMLMEEDKRQCFRDSCRTRDPSLKVGEGQKKNRKSFEKGACWECGMLGHLLI